MVLHFEYEDEIVRIIKLINLQVNRRSSIDNTLTRKEGFLCFDSRLRSYVKLRPTGQHSVTSKRKIKLNLTKLTIKHLFTRARLKSKSLYGVFIAAHRS